MIHQVPMSRLYKDVSEKVETRWKQLYSQDGPHFEGEYCKQAEKLLNNIVQRKYSFITTSGTASIHVMLLAQGIEPGDEVVCVNHSAPATAMVENPDTASQILANRQEQQRANMILNIQGIKAIAEQAG